MDLNNSSLYILQSDNKPIKIRGFLLFICVYQTILVPFFSINILYRNYPQLFNFSGYDNLVIFIILFSFTVSLIMSLFSFVSGILLWSKNNRAVLIAKIYYISSLFFSLIDTFINFLTYLGGREITIQMIIFYTIMKYIIPTLFLIFFFQSKRVKSTFSKSTSPNTGLPSGAQ